jgi:hypothetical protein
LKLLEHDNVPNLVANAPTKTKCNLSVLFKTPVGLNIPSEIRVPVAAYVSLLTPLETSHKSGHFHNEVSPSCFLLATESPVTMLLNDFGSTATEVELAGLTRVCTRTLFYDVEAQVPFGDLCAFVRSVFYLTQATFCYADVVTLVIDRWS